MGEYGECSVFTGPEGPGYGERKKEREKDGIKPVSVCNIIIDQRCVLCDLLAILAEIETTLVGEAARPEVLCPAESMVENLMQNTNYAYECRNAANRILRNIRG